MIAAIAVASSPWLGLAFLALAGAADTVSVVCRSALVQLHTPDALRGRVSAAEQAVGVAGPDLGNCGQDWSRPPRPESAPCSAAACSAWPRWPSSSLGRLACGRPAG